MAFLLLLLLPLALPLLHAQPQPTCNFRSPDENYQIEWQLNPDTQLVSFQLTARATAPNFWTGIGIGERMRDADFLIVVVEDGGVKFRDMHLLSSSNRPPDEDTSNDIRNPQSQLRDGFLTARFSRLLDTGDSDDKKLSQCTFFQFPTSGGQMFFGQLGKHTLTPTTIPVCPAQCTPPATNPPIPRFTPPPPTPVPQPRPQPRPQPQPQPRPQPRPQPPPQPRPQPQPQPQPTAGALPPGCSFESGGYRLTWLYNPLNRGVRFELRVPDKDGDWWSGVGVGKVMAGGDMILVTKANGQVDVTDRYATGRSQPQVDSRVDVRSQGGVVRDGYLASVFTRGLDTGDPQDLPLQDPALISDGLPCQYFQFPVEGGIVFPDGRISQHGRTPVVRKVCGISECYSGGRGGRVLEEAVKEEFNVPTVQCAVNHFDHPLCRSYFEEYFQNVTNWASNNGLQPRDFYSKGCFILSEAQNGLVRSVCCKTFSTRCNN